uniref:Uncharacterized protein n=1 Tax=Meloidogyne javanica TaxID=6303 RepID=A0A915LPY0_MELJA
MHLQLFQQPYKPQSEYTFTVEAYDSDEDPRGERKHQRSAINEEIEGEEEEAISPKAWATRIRTVDK